MTASVKSMSLSELRSRYRELHHAFIQAGLDPSPFGTRLYGETDMERIRDGVSAMEDHLRSKGVLPLLHDVDDDNRPEYQHALSESVSDYLDRTPVRQRQQPSAARSTASSHNVTVPGVASPVAGKFYMVGNVPLLVVKSRNGNLYAQTRTPQGRWEYQKGAIFALRSHGRLATVDDIAQYGLASGKCFVCGKKLSKPASVNAGIGPHCAKIVRSQ